MHSDSRTDFVVEFVPNLYYSLALLKANRRAQRKPNILPFLFLGLIFLAQMSEKSKAISGQYLLSL